MRIYNNGCYVDATPKQIDSMKAWYRRNNIYERHRQFSQEEVTNLLLKQQINTITVSDEVALKAKSYYPTFQEIIGQTITAGFKFTYNGDLYKVISPQLTILETWNPEVGTESMFMRIDETYEGTDYDPIPYKPNMILEADKYYLENNVLYKCIHGTGNPVYAKLSELSNFVEVVDEHFM